MSSDASGTLIRQTCELCGAAVSTLLFERSDGAPPVSLKAP